MKSNNGGLPNSLPDTLALAESMMKGLNTYEVSLGIMYNTKAVIGGHVLALTAAMDLFGLARKAKRDAYRDQRTAV